MNRQPIIIGNVTPTIVKIVRLIIILLSLPFIKLLLTLKVWMFDMVIFLFFLTQVEQ